MTADFLSGLMEIKRKWNNLFKSVKKKKKKWDPELYIKYSENIFRNEGEIKTFSDEGRLKNLLPAAMF